MKFRLAIIILVGIVATMITLYVTRKDENVNVNLAGNQPRKARIAKRQEQIVAKRRLGYDPMKIAATERDHARVLAGEDKGRIDPFDPITDVISIQKKLQKDTEVEEKVDLPPPPETETGLLPPPPAMQGDDLPPGPGDLSTSELPPPPESREMNQVLSLNAILGDKVVLAFNDRSYARAHNYDRYITLGLGQKIGPLKVVDINTDMIVVEENGAVHEMKLPYIR